MDDEGRPERWWARLLFQPREHNQTEYRLGLAVVGIALFLLLLVYGPFIPTLIGDAVLGLINLMSWIGSLFSGSGAGEVATPVLTADPTVVPSPSPSPIASPSPSPLPR